MTVENLAAVLRAMYDDPSTGKAVSIHLFGVRYADALDGVSLPEIVAMAGISHNYTTEIRKGINLAQYVVEK